MSALQIVLTVLLSLVSLVWFSRHLMIWREKRLNELLNDDSPGPPDESPKISVIIAAKDEADVIETCVRTMLDQDYPNYEVIVCNDRSDDDTAAIVERIAVEDDKLRLINITDLPDGWYGKPNAMQTGIAASTGEYICMIDADCRQLSRRTLSVAMQHALDCGADLLSVLPVLEMKGFWENVVQPVCSALMIIWFRPDRVNDPAKRTAYANGAFMLIKREAYHAIGTHEAVRQELNEDMHMAAHLKRAGLRLKVIRAEGLYTVRMYTSFGRILRGWGRIFFGTFGTLGRLLVTLAVVLLMSLLTWVAAGVGLSLAAAGAGGGW
ncbi:MAG: glycosyltransferase, partial [Phycisphaerae bacterium]|nr:glycosyltransferase [Phycisphaerae bacterium]